MKYKILFFLLSSNLFAQNYKLEVVNIWLKNKSSNSERYVSWGKTKHGYFINIKDKTIESSDNPDSVSSMKILRKQKATKNKNGDDLLRYDCQDAAGKCKVWFIKFLKPLKNGIVGQIVLDFEVATNLSLYSVKINNSHYR